MYYSEKINDIVEKAIETTTYYYKSGDGLNEYDHIFIDHWSTVLMSPAQLKQWLCTALDGDHREYEISKEAVTVYRRWLETRKNMNEFAEPEYSNLGFGYFLNRDTLSAYTLPESYQVADYEQCKRYPRIMKHIEDSGRYSATYCSVCGLQVYLDGQIEYRATSQHKRAARLIVALFNGDGD